MQARIIEAALPVFAAAGEHAPVIDDFIKAAGVARGTFYNYYKSTAELLEATRKWLDDDLIQSIEGEIGALTDPSERLVLGVRLWLRKAAKDPDWCAFMVKAREVGKLVYESLSGDLRNGRRAGLFDYSSSDAAFDLVVGTVREAMNRLANGRVRRNFESDVARVILQGLGMKRRAVEALLSRPVPTLRRPTRTIV